MPVDQVRLAASLRALTPDADEPRAVGLVSGRLLELCSAVRAVLGADGLGVLLQDAEGVPRPVAAAAVTRTALADTEHVLDRLGAGEGAHAVHGVLSVPVVVDGEVVGSVHAVHGTAREWSAQERAAAADLAGVLASLLVMAVASDRPDDLALEDAP